MPGKKVCPPVGERTMATSPLEEEHGRLKRLVADLSLDKHMLSKALRKKV